MATIKDSAMAYEPQQTKVVSDLEKFDANMDIQEFEGQDKDGKEFSYSFIEDVEGVKYRIPVSVLKQLKVFLEEDPEQTMFKVKKNGEGMNTTYTVMPVRK